MDGDADCAFYLRTLVSEAPTWRYTMIHLNGPRGDGKLRTKTPPAVNDLIHLWDELTNTGGTYVVRKRYWLHSSFGSWNWPVLEQRATTPPMLDVIVDMAESIFADEAIEQGDKDD